MAEETYLTSPEWLEHLAARKDNTIALDKHCADIKRVAYHAQECANATEQVVVQARQTGFTVTEAIKEIKEWREISSGEG